MKKQLLTAFAALGLMLFCPKVSTAQTALIGPNQYAFQFTGNPNFGLFFNATNTRYEFRNGVAASVLGIDANNGNFTSNLQFAAGSDFLVGPNRYAFRSSVSPLIGLYATNTQIQFLGAAANPLLSITLSNGNIAAQGGLTVGNASGNTPGTIRYNGSDLQGNNGSGWVSLTGVGPAGPAGPAGPQGPAGLLPAGVATAVPYYGGGTWNVGLSALRSDGTSVGAGTAPSTSSRLVANGLVSAAVPGNSTIRANRFGSSDNTTAATSWSVSQADAAVRGFVDWGNSYSAAVYGSSILDFENSAAVVGSNNGGTVFGALAYRINSTTRAGYFNGIVEISDRAFIGSGTSPINSRLAIEKLPVASDSIGIYLASSNNNIQMNNWVFGETSGAGIPIGGDLTLGRLGAEQYIFWSGYFRPVVDASKSLGTLSGRWTTVYAQSGTINTSDAREKKNVEKLEYGLAEVMKMKPVNFEWNNRPQDGKKIGFIAQDLLEIIPEVVVTKEAVENRETGEITYKEADIYGVFYADIIPVLANAIQEQQAQIEELKPEAMVSREDFEDLKAENALLKDQIAEIMSRLSSFDSDLQSCCMSHSGGGKALGVEMDRAELGQNIPNPFGESTIIKFYLPANANQAVIRVTNLDGKAVQDFKLDGMTGHNQVEFTTSGLASGTYLYTLFVDGDFISTKKMMIAR